jgi:hypothetical protein
MFWAGKKSSHAAAAVVQSPHDDSLSAPPAHAYFLPARQATLGAVILNQCPSSILVTVTYFQNIGDNIGDSHLFFTYFRNR